MIRNPEGADHVWTAFSHSGNERNRLFLNRNGSAFSNISGVSGLDTNKDGRSFVIWDFNKDGRPDIALVNANRPLLNFFENKTMVTEPENQFIAVRLIGANHSAQASPGKSNRDGIGSRLSIDTGEQKLLRALSAGEGFASQNGKTMLVGIGKASQALTVEIIWPSGKRQLVKDVAAGSLVICDESNGKATIGVYGQ
ncbi:CRTAC1 family protein [Oceaniferula spumae]|uniref:CRTAC1 family protein n=1 Tax=Oceaniferula spumae TaxID=2979115 RepID=UPI003F4EBDCE